MIPKSYMPVSWRCTTQVDPTTGDIGISFETAGKDAIRIRIDKANATYLFDSIYEYYQSDTWKSKPPTSSEIRCASNSSPIEIKRVFIKALSSLVDEYSGDDFELMTKLEDFARQILIIIDGCQEENPPVFLAVGAFTNDIISGELHHEIIRCRMGKNPVRMKATRERFKLHRRGKKDRNESEGREKHAHQ